jgi:hypothetical protein
VLETLL